MNKLEKQLAVNEMKYGFLQFHAYIPPNDDEELPKAGVEDDTKAGCELPKAGEDEAPNGEAG